MRELGSYDPGQWWGEGLLTPCPAWPLLSATCSHCASRCSGCVASGLRDSPQGWEGGVVEIDSDIAACAPRSQPPRNGCTPHGSGKVGPTVWGMSCPRGFSQG